MLKEPLDAGTLAGVVFFWIAPLWLSFLAVGLLWRRAGRKTDRVSGEPRDP